jgi:hypothetical protein
MVKNGKGTILFTGATASLRGSAKFGGFAAPKFAFRALAQSIAREFGPQAVHVAHIIIDGQINTPRQVKGNLCCFLQKEKLVFIYSAQPDRDIDSFLNSDAVGIILRLLVLSNKRFIFFRLLRHIGNYIFNLVQHGHKNLTFVLQSRSFNLELLLLKNSLFF